MSLFLDSDGTISETRCKHIIQLSVISEIAKIDDSSKKKLMENNIIPLLVQITESEIMSAKLGNTDITTISV